MRHPLKAAVSLNSRRVDPGWRAAPWVSCNCQAVMPLAATVKKNPYSCCKVLSYVVT